MGLRGLVRKRIKQFAPFSKFTAQIPVVEVRGLPRGNCLKKLRSSSVLCAAKSFSTESTMWKRFPA